jgi:hypothetical protein
LLAKIWKHGFVEIHKIKHIDSIGAYVSKYLTKEAFEGRMKGKRKYFYSKNLNLPIEIYENIYTGKVKMKQFEINGD